MCGPLGGGSAGKRVPAPSLGVGGAMALGPLQLNITSDMEFDRADAPVELEEPAVDEAPKPSKPAPVNNVPRVDFGEVKSLQWLGNGTYGRVEKVMWRNRVAAAKIVDKSYKKEFEVELNNLRRVSHPKLVSVYAYCVVPMCIIMEFMEHGSLFLLLHADWRVRYTCGHAINWFMQIADGARYLHQLKMVHRDLKSPNVLLSNYCRTIKICDFGAMVDLKTIMTNNTGSACWMAPEVIKGSNYSEKCDLYSFAIIMWEVLTRRKPFDGYNGFTVQWQVTQGGRPPLVAGCPQRLEQLMIECWRDDPDERPDMEDVYRRLSELKELFPGGDEWLQCHNSLESVYEDPMVSTASHGMPLVTPMSPVTGQRRSDGRRTTDRQPAMTDGTEPVTRDENANRPPPLVDVVETPPPCSSDGGLTPLSDAPPMRSRTYSDASFEATPVRSKPKQYRPLNQKGHRRGGSYETALIKVTEGGGLDDEAYGCDQPGPSTAGAVVPPGRLSIPNSVRKSAQSISSADLSPVLIPPDYDGIDPEQRPIPPLHNNQYSHMIFEEHCQVADAYVRAANLYDDLKRQKRQKIGTASRQRKYEEQLAEKQQLVAYRDLLKEQLTRKHLNS